MALYKKPDSPFWWADIRIAGRRHRISTKQKSPNLARQIESALILELSSGGHQTARKAAPLLREYAKSFLAFVTESRKAAKTKDYYRNGWRMLSTQSIAGMRLDQITSSTAEIIRIKGSGATQNCALRTLRRMLALAEEKNLIPRAPRVHLVEESEREALIDANTEAVILANADSTLHDAYLLIADCGLRPSDAVAVRWDDVDFALGEILVAGGKTGRKGRRLMRMSSRVREMLVERARKAGGGIYVFPSRWRKRDGQHIKPIALSRSFSRLKVECKLPGEVVLYSARHTFATHITEATGDITKTQKSLGHTQLKTTARYVHAKSADTGSIMDAVNESRLGHVFGHGRELVQ